MPSSISSVEQRQYPASKSPRSDMMRDYLVRGPETVTERLVSRGGDTLGASTTGTPTENTCLMAAYLDQLVQQVQGNGGDS